MGDLGEGITEYPILVVTFIVGATVLVLVYISSLLKSKKQEENQKTSEANMVQKEKAAPPPPPSKSSKKKHEKWGRDSKQAFSHPWLLTSLKGHTGSVLDMDFSSNGKFLATCAEDTDDLDPGGEVSEQTSGNSSSSEGTKSSPTPSSRSHGLTRRQKKNHRIRREDDSPTSQVVNSNTKKSRIKTRRSSNSCDGTGKRGSFCASLLRQSLNLSDSELYMYLREYSLSSTQLYELGFPVESTSFPGKAVIFKSFEGCAFSGLSREANTYNSRPLSSSASSNLFDVNAREFIPMSIQKANALHRASQLSSYEQWEEGSEAKDNFETNNNDVIQCDLHDSDKSSEEGSTSSSQEISSESDSSENMTDLNVKDEQHKEFVKTQNKVNRESPTEQKNCVRCRRDFFVADGDYLTQERCLYHWGKMQNTTVYPEPGTGKVATSHVEYSCCHGKPASKGCTTAKLHVWSGLNPGLNGPFDQYVRTRARKAQPPNGYYGIYGVDCEMSYTTRGLELVKVSIVAVDGHMVYDTLVKPDNSIIDYNTRYSGISARHFSKVGVTAKSLREVQNDLMGFIFADTILIGHGLENDLRALKIIHGTVVDTSVVFPHSKGLPFRRSLKTLASTFLYQSIQQDTSGHNSFEDARACIELMLLRIKEDFRLDLPFRRVHIM